MLILLSLQRDASELCFIILTTVNHFKNIDPLQMKTTKTTSQETEVEIGEFGPIYRQFERKPKEAILFLKKQKNGECVDALYRDDIGYVDIVWGVGGKSGYGLCHIIEEH